MKQFRVEINDSKGANLAKTLLNIKDFDQNVPTVDLNN